MGSCALKINFVIGPQKNVVFFNLCHLLLTLLDLEVTWSIFFITGQVFVCLQISILILGSKNQVEERRVLLSIKRTQSHDSLTLAPKSPTHLHLSTSKVFLEKKKEKKEFIWNPCLRGSKLTVDFLLCSRIEINSKVPLRQNSQFMFYAWSHFTKPQM